ncbi:uncharacterized protein LOC132842153 [Tachysurus vachellii]|uniref:uncharacterized protein LOC132842153 n=1 Tax=Tachysurus vachellii TaxID=175792 RepID=UPI00296AA9F6|nr:uncharacterized protein LOC132842153 [Tachysurus vachellii]
MSVTSLPLSAGEDTFELHSVELELEAVEKQIRDLPAQRTQEVVWPGAVHSSTRAPHIPGAAVEDTCRAPVEDPPTTTTTAGLRDPHPEPLRETARDTVIIGDSIIRHVRATVAKGKARTHCLPGAHVLDVAAQVPRVGSRNIGAVVLHAGSNDTSLRQSEIPKRDFKTLVETARSTAPTARIIVSGPLPAYQRGIERLFRTDGLHPSRVGVEILLDQGAAHLLTASRE